MAKTAFTDGNRATETPGTLVTAAFLIALNNHIHDGADTDGHADKIALAHVAADLIACLVPAGAVQAFAMSAAPTGWLVCNGAAVSRSTYAALFAAISTTFGAGNGTTTFNVPDLRGEFVRGWDDARGIDSGRAFGTWQKGSVHSFDTGSGAGVVGDRSDVSSATGADARADLGYDSATAGDYPYGQAASSASGVGTGVIQDTTQIAFGSTRPRNVALHYCIKC